MDLTLDQVPLIALICLLAALLQGAIGFGLALLAIPLMVWAGVELPVAIAVVQIVAATQMGWGCWAYRRHIDWKPAVGVNLCRLLTLPLGVLTLVYLVASGPGPVKLVVGVMLLLAVAVRVLVRVKPRAKVRWWWAALAGTVSGYVSGLVAMSGPPVVLWVTAHQWSTQKMRAMIWICLLPTKPVAVVLLISQFGMPVVWGTLLGVALVPVTLLGGMSGMRLGGRMSAEHLRAVALIVLVIIALVSIIEPAMAMWGMGE